MKEINNNSNEISNPEQKSGKIIEQANETKEQQEKVENILGNKDLTEKQLERSKESVESEETTESIDTENEIDNSKTTEGKEKDEQETGFTGEENIPTREVNSNGMDNSEKLSYNDSIDKAEQNLNNKENNNLSVNPNDIANNEISPEDKAKLDSWTYRPSDSLYKDYKNVFDNPKYYDQESGAVKWPDNDGFKGEVKDEMLTPGTRIDRYGSDFGSFTSPFGTEYEKRSVAPGTKDKLYSVFEVIRELPVKSGEVAPWFDEPGGGIQYKLPKSVDDLLEDGYLRRLDNDEY